MSKKTRIGDVINNIGKANSQFLFTNNAKRPSYASATPVYYDYPNPDPIVTDEMILAASKITKQYDIKELAIFDLID